MLGDRACGLHRERGVPREKVALGFHPPSEPLPPPEPCELSEPPSGPLEPEPSEPLELEPARVVVEPESPSEPELAPDVVVPPPSELEPDDAPSLELPGPGPDDELLPPSWPSVVWTAAVASSEPSRPLRGCLSPEDRPDSEPSERLLGRIEWSVALATTGIGGTWRGTASAAGLEARRPRAPV
jgi:hypothetical protein